MKNKTAMQIAIEWVNDNYPKFNHHEIEAKLTELRDTVEKEQIQGAITFGINVEAGIAKRNYSLTLQEDFYNQTYKP